MATLNQDSRKKRMIPVLGWIAVGFVLLATVISVSSVIQVNRLVAENKRLEGRIDSLTSKVRIANHTLLCQGNYINRLESLRDNGELATGKDQN